MTAHLDMIYGVLDMADVAMVSWSAFYVQLLKPI